VVGNIVSTIFVGMVDAPDKWRVSLYDK